MITKSSFKSKALKRLYEGNRSKVAPDHADFLEDILAIMQDGSTLDDVDLPGKSLHHWNGTGKGKDKVWSLSVNGPFRVLFQLDHETGEFFNIDYGEFHGKKR